MAVDENTINSVIKGMLGKNGLDGLLKQAQESLKPKRISFPKDRFSIPLDKISYHEEKGNGSLLILNDGKEKHLPNYSWEEVERLINS